MSGRVLNTCSDDDTLGCKNWRRLRFIMPLAEPTIIVIKIIHLEAISLLESSLKKPKISA